ncbi:MAG: glutamate racemase [Candidatus Aminicenantes bacterium]|nr:glutamate racemase [Candidatus Aminicenantes bacterium]
MNNKAIGVFDSGIGGLTVYKALKERLPAEKVVYLGDTARLPYGSKSAETIIHFSQDNAGFLLTRDIKIIVVACNSASSHAIPHLQDKFDKIPVLGVIEPGAEAAVENSSGKIGVIGTTATIMSGAYERAILERKPDARIIAKDCPLFVPLVEEGWANHHVTKLVAEEYLLPLKQAGIDSLVLGCTHYPVLKDVIAGVLGEGIRLIDSAETTARKVHTILKTLGWLSRIDNGREDEFYVTDFPDRFKKVGEIFLRRKIANVATVDVCTMAKKTNV